MKKFVFSFALLAIAYGVCVSCTSDDDYYAGGKQYSYSAGELAEIQEMQSEYGVDFEFRKSGDRPLPSLEQMEKLCKAVAIMQQGAKHFVKKGNAAYFTSERKRKTRIGVDSESYSGEYTTHNSNNGYGIFEYTITWSNVNPTWGTGSVDYSILSEPSISGIYFEYGFDYSYVGGNGGISYTIYVTARDSMTNGEAGKFKITGEVH